MITRLFTRAGRSIGNDPSNKGKFGEMIVKSIFQLKKMKNIEHAFISDIYFKDSKGNTHQVDHILVYDKGIYCIETKNISGIICVGNIDDVKWLQVVGKKNNQIYSPVKQNLKHCKVVGEFLNNKYKVHSIVVFIKENKPKTPMDGVINFSELKNYILNMVSDVTLTNEEIKDIGTLLTNHKNSFKVDRKEHIERINDKYDN